MNDFILFPEGPALIAICGLFGLIIGSFLNVVIHRLPLMMERAWRRECREFLEPGSEPPSGEPEYNLWRPGSQCPHCRAPVRFWQNVPLLSYLWLRGRCAACGAAISRRYPLVEMLTGVLFATVAWHFGASWQTLAASGLTAGLIALAFIDLDHLVLPDDITLPLLWLGLLLNAQGFFCSLETALYGAVTGYLLLWTVHRGFLLLTGREGMGFGDFKLLAMLGAWMGWPMLPVIILFSSISGAVIGSIALAVGGKERDTPIPFGPFLAAGGWIALLWGNVLNDAYWRWASVGG
ncbi:A24 family peptidase [Methylococcus sp. ANG]|uniref:prepilin peptidase n=1 Tax=unclassified Methylococcus TaxID=2618889 RepID=UPI001C53420D|nr:A24 family peptidase [Methylococcus sp. Mc7]QXP83169.1 A24 family peptidase [Methylococcus sp. Mc7]